MINIGKSLLVFLHDEINIKSDLVYDKHAGGMIGYVNLDSLGTELLTLESSVKNNTPHLATSLLV